MKSATTATVTTIVPIAIVVKQSSMLLGDVNGLAVRVLVVILVLVIQFHFTAISTVRPWLQEGGGSSVIPRVPSE
jgi:hypothetical protein